MLLEREILDGQQLHDYLDRVLPVHQVVPVDIYMPGCPPSADRIKATLEPLLKGENGDLLTIPAIDFTLGTNLSPIASRGKELALDYLKSAVGVGGQFRSIAATGSE